MAIDKKDFPIRIKANLFTEKTHKIFYYDFTINKKRSRGLIDYTLKGGWNKRDRISAAEVELIKIKNNKENNISDDISLDNFMDHHFSLLKDTNWKTTKVSHYRRYISPHIGLLKINQLRQHHIKKVILEQEKEELAPRTIKQTLEILLPAFKEAMANRIIEFNPCDGIKIKLPKTKKIVMNATNRLKEVFYAIVDVYKNDPFYQAFYLFALQGRRKGEIINLKWKNVSFENDYYIIEDTKNDETQKMYLPLNIKVLLFEFKNDKNEYVFTSERTGNRLVNISSSMKRLKNVLGDDFSIHYLRNVITSAMGEVGVEAIYQSGALGHNDLTTINKYSSLNYLKGSKVASDVIANITDV